MIYSIWIREDADGNDITREQCTRFHTQESLKEHTAEAERILNEGDPTVAMLFQQGATLEVADSNNSFIELKVIGIDESMKIKKLKDKTNSRNKYISRGRITFNHTSTKGEINCLFAVKTIRTGHPG